MTYFEKHKEIIKSFKTKRSKFCYIRGKNGYVEVFKNLARYRFENNIVGKSK